MDVILYSILAIVGGFFIGYQGRKQNLSTKVKSAESKAEKQLAGVKNFPARIKSATLCWHAMNAALNGKENATTE